MNVKRSRGSTGRAMMLLMLPLVLAGCSNVSVAIRERFRQYNATIGAGSSAADTGVLLADVLSKSLERNRQLAEYADPPQKPDESVKNSTTH